MTKNIEIILFERDFDQRVTQLKILTQPIRCILSAYYGLIDSQFHGNRMRRGAGRRPEVGAALACRMSYLTRLFLSCPAEPLGKDALDALSPLRENPELLGNLRILMDYSHFSELMPEVHRGYYNVIGDRANGFILEHPSEDVATFEARDIVLCELSLPFVIQAAPIPEEIIDRSLGELPILFLMVKLRYDETRFAAVEPKLMTDTGYLNATGGTHAQFSDFRAAWCAFAECSLALADGYVRKMHAEGATMNEDLHRDLLEWTCVCLNRNFFLGMVQALTGLSPAVIDRFMQLYSVVVGSTEQNAAADGFFPPFWRLDNVLIFNPDVVRSMMTSRNIPFALNRIDPEHFARNVSKYLEPALVEEFQDALSSFGAIVRTSVIWSNGEMDLLAYEAETNIAIHVQAKGAIPAQGARMVRAVEDRTREALEQLRRFRMLPGTQRDSILSTATGLPVVNAQIIDVVLVRSGIGSWKVWKDLGGAIPLNVALFRAAIDQHAPSKGILISEVLARIPSTLDDIVARAALGWDATDTDFNGIPFRMPLLQLDNQLLAELRLAFAGPNGRAALEARRRHRSQWPAVLARLRAAQTPPKPKL